jgi:hypothetical protein
MIGKRGEERAFDVGYGQAAEVIQIVALVSPAVLPFHCKGAALASLVTGYSAVNVVHGPGAADKWLSDLLSTVAGDIKLAAGVELKVIVARKEATK